MAISGNGPRTPKYRSIYSNKEEFDYYKTFFRKGISCQYGDDPNDLISVYLDDNDSMKVKVNKGLKSQETSESFIRAIVGALNQSFMRNYLEAMGVIDGDNPKVQQEIAKKVLQELQKGD